MFSKSDAYGAAAVPADLSLLNYLSLPSSLHNMPSFPQGSSSCDILEECDLATLKEMKMKSSWMLWTSPNNKSSHFCADKKFAFPCHTSHFSFFSFFFVVFLFFGLDFKILCSRLHKEWTQTQSVAGKLWKLQDPPAASAAKYVPGSVIKAVVTAEDDIYHATTQEAQEARPTR